MDFDNGWKALLAPGDTDAGYFGLADRIELEPAAAEYRPATAWFLAETSRLVYQRDAALRDAGLARMQLEATAFADRRTATDGFVAVTDAAAPRRFAVLAFRGTDDLRDWLTNLDSELDDWRGRGRVHDGFQEALETVWEQIEERLEKIPDADPLLVSGHSLGGALAILSASLLGARIASTYVFGAPRVGDAELAATLDDRALYRVVNNRDLVTRLPPRRLGFADVGELRYINHRSEMWRNPSRKAVREDRKLRLEPRTPENRRRFFDPPEDLADHTPQNYVAHLERLVAD